MSSFDKLRKKIEQKPYRMDVTMEEIEKYLNHYGVVKVRQNGSHWIFRKSGYGPLPIPYHGVPIKPAYVKQAVEMVENIKEEEGSYE